MKELDQKIIELMDLFDDEQVTTADKIDRPQQALEKEAIDDFMKRNPMAGGGMLVQPGFGGTRQGYKDENIRKTRDGTEVSDKKTKVFKYPRKNFLGKTIYYKTPQITRAGIEGVPKNVGTKLSKPKDGKQYQVSSRDKNYLFKTEKQAVDFYNKNIKKGSGAQIKDTFDKQSKELKEFFKNPKIYKRFYDGPLNASSIDKIWLNISSMQKRQAKQLLKTKNKNIKEADKLTKQGYIRVTDLADKLGRSSSLELVESMKNSQKFKKLFPNYLDGMITASNNTKWIKTTPSTLTKLKQWADDPFPSGLRDSTIKNVQTAFKDKKLMDYWKNWKPGTPVDQKLIDSVHGKKGSAYTMMQLGRTLQGKEPIEGVRKNVALGNKIIEAVRYKAKEFGDWHTAAYKYAKQDMDTFLPPGKSGITFGDYQRLLTKSLKDVGLEGFEVDEINALRSGVRGGTQPYSVFSQVLEGKYNRGLKRRFDGENAKNQMKLNNALSMKDNETIRFRPKGASNILTMGKQDYIKYILKLQNDQVDNFFTKAPQLKGKVSLPKFDLRDPKTVYGSRFNTFDPGVQNAILKNFKEVGYTVDVGKKALTQKELLTELTSGDKVRLARIGCPGKATGGRIGYFEGQNLTACAIKGAEKIKNNPINLTGGDQQNLRALGKSVKAVRFLKNFLGPAAVAGELIFEGGFATNKFMNKGVPLKQALGESYINKYILGPKTQIDVEAEREKEFAKGEDFAMAKRGERMRPFMAQSATADAQRLKKREEEMKALYPQLDMVDLPNKQIDELLAAQGVYSPFTLGFGMQQKQPGVGDMKYNEDAAYDEIRDIFKKGAEEDIRKQQMQSIADAGGVANLAKGGRAGFKLGTVRKGVLSLIDKSVKSTPKNTTPDLDALIKKTLDEDFFDKKDRIIDNINAKISRARAKGLDSEEIGEGQIEFYDDITKSNFRTKTGPFFDRRKRAGGGILKQAGDSSGPPPESGPMSEGLQGLMKRGIKT
jgi:hypothetical protein